ncbi:MAG: hypothetical protein MUP13_08635 [Thermoanaerobaculales bacterium]|nr:hypothetical protein [Thermoanaerobaculales bacterium]
MILNRAGGGVDHGEKQRSWLWPRGGWMEATKSHPLVPPGHGSRLVTV